MASPLTSITWNYKAPTNIKVFFGAAGVSVTDSDGTFTSTGWSAAEKTAAMAAFQNFSDVTNVKFTYVNSIGQADFVLLESANEAGAADNFGYWNVAGGALDYGGTDYALDGWGVFNTDDNQDGVASGAGDAWTPANLKVGAYGYITLIHEIGHGMGLAHPHDDGGGSTVMQGVTPDAAFGDYGNFNLNQGIWTTMSYNDGWHTAPHVPERTADAVNYGFGWQGTLMALDIAVLQQKYGANMTYHTGNDTYVLPATNGAGTYYKSIWDAGGVDTIRYNGAAAVVINLNAATLTYSASGGGFASYAKGIYGGFTIANKVVIERAIGGAGSDTITGNAAANMLSGGNGNDKLLGVAGNDSLLGGLGNDTLAGGANNDAFVFNTGLNAATNKDTIADFANLAGNNDNFQLDNAVFATLGAVGALVGAFFRLGTAALDANDHIIYNKPTGALVYDTNGNVAGGATLFATLTNKPTLTAGDFVVI
jgi:serralysin